MLNIQRKVDGLKDLEKYTLYIERLSTMKTDINFQKYIQQKCMEAVQKITNERLIGGTTDDDMIEEYKTRHKIQEETDGFIIYNDTVLPAYMLNTANPEDYSNGFSIALAFEYGIGIVGENSPKANAWQYNVKNHNFAWYYQKYGKTFSTYGYQGFEIYRYTAEEIKAQLPKWVNDYYKMKEV